jgi:hypothetical protein
MLKLIPLIPAQAGIQAACLVEGFWVAAFAGTSLAGDEQVYAT